MERLSVFFKNIMKYWFYGKSTADFELDNALTNEDNVENVEKNCNDTDVESIVENNSRNYPKKVSGKKSTTRKSPNKSDHDHQEIELDKEKAIQCDICNEMFHSQRKLAFHKKSHEKDPYDKELYDQFIAENFDMKCDQCDEKFSTFDDARRHYKECHNEEKGWIKCCGKKLRSLLLIRDHIKKHLNPEQFK